MTRYMVHKIRLNIVGLLSACVAGAASAQPGATPAPQARPTPTAAADVPPAGEPMSAVMRNALAQSQRTWPEKIVGGWPANLGDDPWQVVLLANRGPEPRRIPFCGGSIVAPRWVLTAAHCVDGGTQAASVDILAGVIDLRTGGHRMHIRRIIIHNGYHENAHEDDLALLELDEDAGQTRIAMVSDNQVAASRTHLMRVTGWGAVAEKGPMRGLLRWTTVAFIPTDIPNPKDPSKPFPICNADVSYNGAIGPHMICAGLEKGGADTCQGDSGGPLSSVVDGKPVLVGVTSWGEGCGRKDKPGVYTDVASYRMWAQACMDGGKDCLERP